MNQRLDARLSQWVETLALHFARIGGLPLIAGRIVGWLMVCEPVEQSAEQIAAAIGASRASLSTNLRLLAAVGMVSVRTRRGERTRFYHIDDNGWEAAVRLQVAALGTFVKITSDGIGLMGGSKSRTRRLKSARRVFQWMEDVFANAPPVPTAEQDDA